MNDIGEEINRIAAEGTRRFNAGKPRVSNAEILKDARRAVRVRAGTRIGVGVAAVALLTGTFTFALPKIGNRDVEPANPLPGDLVWSADVGAEMWGSPAVLGDRVYVGANDGSVRAFDLADGAPAWTFDAGAAVRASITTDGSMLFVAADDNAVVALRDDGTAPSVVWSAQLGTRHEQRGVYDTFGSAPTVAGDLVILGSADGGVYGLDRADGTQTWKVQTYGVVRSTAAVSDGVAYIGSNDGYLYAIDAATGAQLWSQSLGNSVTPSPAVVGDLVVVGSRGTSVVALDTSTGTVAWEYSLAPSWAESSPVRLGETLVFGSSAAGTVTAVNPETGELEWSSYVGGWPWSRPTVADGTVYVTTAFAGGDNPEVPGALALDGTTGVILWSFPIGEALRWTPDGRANGAMASPTVADERVLVAGLDGVLYCVAR